MPPAKLVPEQVGGDPAEPGAHGAGRIEVSQPPEGRDEDFLGHALSYVPVLQADRQVVSDDILVEVDDRFQRAIVPGPGAQHDPSGGFVSHNIGLYPLLSGVRPDDTALP